MISTILHKVSAILNDNIKLSFNLKKDIVKIQSIDNNVTEGSICISLLNIERDTNSGISFNRKNLSSSHNVKGNPSWQVNLYILIAAVFPKKQYTESLTLTSEILQVLQSNHILTFDQSGIQLTMEPVNISFQELSNVWGVAGGTYHPSIVCKIKTLQVDGGSIMQLDSVINEREITL